MPCPMRVVYATFIAAVLAAWGLLDMWQAQEEFEAQMGANGEARTAAQQPQGFRQQLRAQLNPLSLLRRLHQRPIFLAVLIFLHMELLVTKFRMSKAIVGEEALDALEPDRGRGQLQLLDLQQQDRGCVCVGVRACCKRD